MKQTAITLRPLGKSLQMILNANSETQISSIQSIKSQSAPNEHESLCNMRLNLTSTPPCKSKAAEHQDHFAVK